MGEREMTDTAEFDTKLACLTFECLERNAAQAASHDEMDVAAEYANTFFYLTAQMSDFYGVFLHESEMQAAEGPNGEEYEAWVSHQMRRIREWSDEHDHPVTEWFDRAEEVLDGDRDV